RERSLVDVRHRGAQRQRRAGDAKALAFRLQRDGGLGAEVGGSEAAALQLERQRHGETAGMRGGDELLGIGALLVLEARFERVGGLVENAGVGRELAVSGAAGAAPNCFRLADHGDVSLVSAAFTSRVKAPHSCMPVSKTSARQRRSTFRDALANRAGAVHGVGSLIQGRGKNRPFAASGGKRVAAGVL